MRGNLRTPEGEAGEEEREEGVRMEKNTKNRWIKRTGHGGEDEHTKTGWNFSKWTCACGIILSGM